MQDHLSPLLASYCLPVLRKLLRSYDGISDLPSRRSVEQAVLACDFVNDLINVKPPSSSVSPSPLSPPASPPFLCDTPLVPHFNTQTLSQHNPISPRPLRRSLQFPPEILFNIFAVLKRDRSTLAACAVVCQIWNPLAVQSLYSSPFQDKDISGLTNCSAALINSVMGVHPVAPKVDPGTLMMKLALGLKVSRPLTSSPFLHNTYRMGDWVRHLNLSEANNAIMNPVHRHRLVCSIVSMCPELRDIKLYMRLDLPTMAHIFRCCPKLIGFSITLPQNHVIPPDAPAAPAMPTPDTANPLSISAAPIFTLTHPPDNSPSDLISDRDMRDLGESISRLHYLLCEVPSASPLANQVASTFTSHLGPSLRELHFSGIDFLTDVPLCSRLGPNLEILRLTECLSIDDNTLSVIPLQCPNLRILDLWGSPSVSDLSVTPIIKSCTKIEAIDITFTSVGVHTIESLHLAPHLHTIFMEGLSCPSRILVDLIRQRGAKLRELILCGCLETGRDVDDVLAAIAEWAVELRQLDVVGCVGPPPAEEETTTMPRISGERVRRVMERCGRLETFAVDEFAVESGVFGELRKRFEVEGVFVSPFWGIHF